MIPTESMLSSIQPSGSMYINTERDQQQSIEKKRNTKSSERKMFIEENPIQS